MTCYHQAGVRTVLVCCTDGGQGRILNPDAGQVGDRANIVEIRRAELAAAAALVGYDDVVRLDYPDSGAPDARERPEHCFARVPLDEAAGRVVEVIRRERPQVVIGYADDQRAYPHPDHIRAHEVAVRAFELAADQDAFPDAGPSWQPLKLYYTVTSRQLRRRINAKYAALGLGMPFGQDTGLQGRGDPDLAPGQDRVTTVIDVAPFVQTWIEGMRTHQCQLKPELAQLLGIPEASAAEFFGREEFILARAMTQRGDKSSPEADLFAGVS